MCIRDRAITAVRGAISTAARGMTSTAVRAAAATTTAAVRAAAAASTAAVRGAAAPGAVTAAAARAAAAVSYTHLISLKKSTSLKIFYRYRRVMIQFNDLIYNSFVKYDFAINENELSDISKRGGGIDGFKFRQIIF